MHSPLADEPVTALRGAGVEVDARRVGHVLVGLGLVALAVLVTVLFVSGAQKNAQITSLRQHGVEADVRVSRCLGLMGGSGSNLAGYRCTGTLTVGGRRYNEVIPGNTLYAPGATVPVVRVLGDPTLISTPRILAAEHASWKVFLLPTILLVLLGVLVGALVFRRRLTHYPLRDVDPAATGKRALTARRRP